MFGAPKTVAVTKTEEPKKKTAMLAGTKYTGKVTVKPGGDAAVSSQFSSKLRKSGTAYLDFSGGDVSNAKVGIKDLKVLDNVQGSVEWSNSKKTGKLKLVSSHIENVKITAEPSLPLPSDLSTVPVIVEAKKSLDIGDATVKVNPLARTATLDLIKKLDHKLCSQVKLSVDATKQTGTLTLNTPKTRQMDIDHSLEVKLVGSKAGLDQAQCVYTAAVTSDLSAKVTLNKDKTGSLSADYKLGPDMKAVASCPITSLSAQGLGKPTFTVETTYEF